MKEQLRHQLRKWPALYNLVAKIYGNLSLYLLAERAIGTKAREKEWATRHRRKGNDWGYIQHLRKKDEWVMSYWDSRNHSHRSLFIEKISTFYPFSSILEIGCNCGPNLYLLAKKFPGIELVGIDVNPEAVQKGNELFAQEGIPNVKLSVATADELEQFQDKSFDIVFTDAVLIYIGRDKIQRIVREMVRVACKGLILMERYRFEPNSKDRYGLGTRRNGLWERDYTALLAQFVPDEEIRVTKITEDIWPDPGWQETGAVIEVTLPLETKHTVV